MSTAASRRPLPADLAARLPAPWRLSMVAETGSSNADLLALAGAGEPAGAVLLAEFQNGGRGRLDRAWSAPPGAGLTFSVLVRPDAPTAAWGWLPFMTGLALRDAVGGDARLKWPNDLLLGPDEAKTGGIFVQTIAGAAVIGVGLNVTTSRAELPVPTATSLALEGLDRLDRAAILQDFLTRFDGYYRAWQVAGGDARATGLPDAYRAACATLGRTVAVQVADADLHGEAVGVDDDGRLLIRTVAAAGLTAVAAGDVIHLRSNSR